MERVRSRIFAGLAPLALAGGLVMAAGTAGNAATIDCGATCVALASQEYGTGYVSAVSDGTAQVGQQIMLSAAGQYSAEDFRTEYVGTVADFLAAGLVTPAFALHYGCIPTVNFPDCFGSTTQSFNDPAFEIEYSPDGVYSGLCAGLASTAAQEEGVTLQECGASPKTVWAIDLYNQPFESIILGYAPLINGSDTNFSQPYVLTAGSSAGDTLTTDQLQTTAGTVNPAQMWQLQTGVLTTPACPQGAKANFRWHYSADGSAGGWSGTTTETCPGTVTMGPQAMEGNLTVSPGDTVQAGYDFTLPGNNTALTLTVSTAEVVFDVACASGATPSQPSFTVTMAGQSYSLTGSQWYPSGDQSSPLVYQGSVSVPDLCGGGSLDLAQGGTFTATLS